MVGTPKRLHFPWLQILVKWGIVGIITQQLLRNGPEDCTTCGGYCAKGRSDRNQLGHRDMAATDSLRCVMEGSSCNNFLIIFLSQKRCEEELKLG